MDILTPDRGEPPTLPDYDVRSEIGHKDLWGQCT